jgi:hypothetical protein
MPSSVRVRLSGPFDLALSLQAAGSFLPWPGLDSCVVKLAIPIEGQPAVVEVEQITVRPAVIRASSTVHIGLAQLRDLAGWLVSGDLDLRPFSPRTPSWEW